MTEQMLYEILVFAAGMTTVLTASALIAIRLKQRPVPSQQRSALDERIERLESLSEATAADVERVAGAQSFMNELLAERRDRIR